MQGSPYRLAMPRAPKDFTVTSVQIQRASSFPRLIAEGVAAPDRFEAEIEVAELPFSVIVTVMIGFGGEALAKRVEAVAPEDGSVTTSALRKVLVDQLVKAAVSEAAFEVKMQPRGAGGISSGSSADAAFVVDGPDPFGGPGPVTYMQPDALPLTGRQQRQDERARRAAAIFSEAVASGSRAPSDAVAREMGYSRSQAARYIKHARELGLLPALDEKETDE